MPWDANGSSEAGSKKRFGSQLMFPVGVGLVMAFS
jgi:hypothetical protein